MKMLLWFASAVLLVGGAVAVAGDWREFRGSQNNSIADDNLPLDIAADGAIAWTADLPGRGPSSPIVVGDRVFVTCSSGVKQDRLHVLCFDAASGRRLWERQFWATGRCFCHPQSAVAAPTPASDGRLIHAYFSSNDLVCLDLDGNLAWLRGLSYDYPRAVNDVGASSSPVVSGQTVIVQVDNQGDSFAAGIDTASGETRWRVERDRLASWSSPVLLHGPQPADDLVLLQSMRKLAAYRVADGQLAWEHAAPCDGISSSTVTDGTIFVPGGGLTALRPNAAAAPDVLWRGPALQVGASSPLVRGGRIYYVDRAGVAVCAAADTGEVQWRSRLSGAFWSTPVLSGNRLYCFNFDGVGFVVEIGSDGGKAEVVGRREFGEIIQASPAVASGALYIRSDKHLWKLGPPA